jgi:hypothetical protein
MRIAQIAPLAESVPPRLYNGSERVVSWLVEQLVELGHDVTLFASGDSQTSAKLIPAWPRNSAEPAAAGPVCTDRCTVGGRRPRRLLTAAKIRINLAADTGGGWGLLKPGANEKGPGGALWLVETAEQ